MRAGGGPTGKDNGICPPKPDRDGDRFLSLLSKVTRGIRELAKTADKLALKNSSGYPTIDKPGLDEYVTKVPCAQNVIDVLPGWNGALPNSAGAIAGKVDLRNDPRILWAMEQFGGIAGLKILELGPLEASHTFMLESHGAALIHSVEANKLAFLRCLVVKELMGMKVSKFFLGDCQKWLENSGETYDFIIASGIFHQVQDPVRLLEFIALRTPAFFLSTPYASDTIRRANDQEPNASTGTVEKRHGLQLRYYERSYRGAASDEGVPEPVDETCRLFERDDILALIRVLGFDDIRVAHDIASHKTGSSFSIFARRTSAGDPTNPAISAK